MASRRSGACLTSRRRRRPWAASVPAAPLPARSGCEPCGATHRAGQRCRASDRAWQQSTTRASSDRASAVPARQTPRRRRTGPPPASSRRSSPGRWRPACPGRQPGSRRRRVAQASSPARPARPAPSPAATPTAPACPQTPWPPPASAAARLFQRARRRRMGTGRPGSTCTCRQATRAYVPGPPARLLNATARTAPVTSRRVTRIQEIPLCIRRAFVSSCLRDCGCVENTSALST